MNAPTRTHSAEIVTYVPMSVQKRRWFAYEARFLLKIAPRVCLALKTWVYSNADRLEIIKLRITLCPYAAETRCAIGQPRRTVASHSKDLRWAEVLRRPRRSSDRILLCPTRQQGVHGWIFLLNAQHLWENHSVSKSTRSARDFRKKIKEIISSFSSMMVLSSDC